jgi:hypothetical protein
MLHTHHPDMCHADDQVNSEQRGHWRRVFHRAEQRSPPCGTFVSAPKEAASIHVAAGYRTFGHFYRDPR